MKPQALVFSILAITLCTAVAWPFSKRDRPPEHMMIEHAYFICDRCESAEGGIYGKGPFKRFRNSTAPKCVHAWRSVPRSEFKQFASNYYHHAWRSEIWFWSRDN